MASRRKTLISGAALALAGCDTLTDATERVLGNAKTPLPGERIAVIATNTRPIGVDAAAAGGL